MVIGVDKVMSRKEWRQKGLIPRIWLIMFCQHPIEKSKKIGVLDNPDEEVHPAFCFKVNVRQCGKCLKYFIDEGSEFKRT